jgi:feruloyl-CoA synthase
MSKKQTMSYKESPFLEIKTGPTDITKTTKTDGSIYLKSAIELNKHPQRMTERLVDWAIKTPENVFLAQRNEVGEWQKLTYRAAYDKVKSIAQYLLQSDVSVEKPVVILSENSIEHGLMALACLHIGLPFSSLATAYSLRSTDYEKLKHIIGTLTPALIFVQNGQQYQKALEAIAGDIPVVAVCDKLDKQIDFQEIANTIPTKEVEAAFEKINSKTVAKVLFTSGSTGLPKGVINTHGNMTTNLQQITQTLAFMAEGDFVLIDWLPWNHTFGGNHNFGLTLYNGGSLYIDGGTPTPTGISTTLKNLREIAPTTYFNVPKGFEMLIPHLKEDKELCRFFFSRLQLFFYAGAGMPQHLWDELEALAFETIGKRLLIVSGLGMTETSPSCTFNTQQNSFAGLLGVPVAGLEIKLVPDGSKMEARYKGNNIMPHYWRNSEATQKAFDDDGFLKTGDALKFLNENNPNEGLIFDGRIAEDFKLDTGTWVNVGILKAKFIAAANGLVQDVVVTGHDRSFLGAIVFLDLNYCKKITNIDGNLEVYISQTQIIDALQNSLKRFAEQNKGSSTFIKRAIIADFNLSIDKGEITDKGTINQRQILNNYASVVEKLYEKELNYNVLEVN